MNTLVNSMNINKEKESLQSFHEMIEATSKSSVEKNIDRITNQFKSLALKHNFVTLEENEDSKAKLNIVIGKEVVAFLDFKIDETSEKHTLQLKTIETEFTDGHELTLSLLKNECNIYGFYPSEIDNHFHAKARMCSRNVADYYLHRVLDNIIYNRMNTNWKAL